MNNEVNGYIYFDAHLLLTELNFDKSKVKHGGMYIRFDNLFTHFDFNMSAYDLANSYAQAQLNIERYADEVAGQTWEICDSLFKIRRFVVTGDEDTYDILVTDDGKAWVHRQIKLYVVGENPEMPTIEINSKIEKQLNEYTKGNIAGVSPECTRNEIVSGIR